MFQGMSLLNAFNTNRTLGSPLMGATLSVDDEIIFITTDNATNYLSLLNVS